MVGKLDLSRGDLTQCHGVLDHGLNLCWNIPLMCEQEEYWKQLFSDTRDQRSETCKESVFFWCV